MGHPPLPAVARWLMPPTRVPASPSPARAIKTATSGCTRAWVEIAAAGPTTETRRTTAAPRTPWMWQRRR